MSTSGAPDVAEAADAHKSKEGSTVGRLARRAARGAWSDDIFTESASAAFWQTLSVPPLLLGLFGALGYVGGWFGPDTVTQVEQWIVATTSGVFSRNAVDEIIAPTVSQILTTARGEIVSIGFVVSLWSGSSAISSFVDAITRAHDQYERRNLVWQRVLALLMYVAALCTGIVVLPIAAIGPNLVPSLLPSAAQELGRELVDVLYYPVLAVAMIIALTTLYKIALPYKPPWWRGLPGAVFAAVLFLAGATGLRLYLTALTNTGYSYGALAAPIAFLLATFFIALSVVAGAHLNAATLHEWPVPLKRRGKVVEQPEDAMMPVQRAVKEHDVAEQDTSEHDVAARAIAEHDVETRSDDDGEPEPRPADGNEHAPVPRQA